MSTEIKEDRRVRKTKRALRECLAQLLTEKSIQNITVRELTDKADIHRSTFYANFTDIYDLYKKIEDATIQEISDIFSQNYTVDWYCFQFKARKNLLPTYLTVRKFFRYV